MIPSPPILVWFRDEHLRLDDNPALTAAVHSGKPVIPVYLRTPDQQGHWPHGGAIRWWLHHALKDLKERLSDRGSDLILRSGPDTLSLLRVIMEDTHADRVVWNRRYLPHQVALDMKLKRELPADSFPGSVLWEPGRFKTGGGTPYKVFTPFYKSCMAGTEPEAPLDEPEFIQPPERWPGSEPLDSWRLLPEIAWDGGLAESWVPTLAGADEQLEGFLDGVAAGYKSDRDTPSVRGTSRLSPYLRFGQISPRRVWHEAQAVADVEGGGTGIGAFMRQLVWRDFAIQMLFHFPHTDHAPLQEKYADFPWRKDPEALKTWQRGQTGYPLVDAGMRELWHTGWMHNRVRMVVSSFLVKDLLISWQEGAAWFWDTLVDADLANNSFGWQWAGGCGADAAPYFRIFNPVRQSQRFDPHGTYIRRWVPELKEVPVKEIHEPWKVSMLAPDYPAPMVDHAAARDRALEALGVVTG